MKERLPRGELLDGRSIEDCLEEYSPRAQAVKDARTREVLKRLDLETDIATARRSSQRSRRSDPVKDFALAFVARHPQLKGRALGRAIARRLDAEGIKPPVLRWIRATGKRLWQDLWDCENLRVQGAIRKFIYTRLVPDDTGSNLPRMREGA